MPALWRTLRSNWGESRPRRVFSNGPRVIDPWRKTCQTAGLKTKLHKLASNIIKNIFLEAGHVILPNLFILQQATPQSKNFILSLSNSCHWITLTCMDRKIKKSINTILINHNNHWEITSWAVCRAGVRPGLVIGLEYSLGRTVSRRQSYGAPAPKT